MIVRKFWMGY